MLQLHTKNVKTKGQLPNYARKRWPMTTMSMSFKQCSRSESSKLQI